MIRIHRYIFLTLLSAVILSVTGLIGLAGLSQFLRNGELWTRLQMDIGSLMQLVGLMCLPYISLLLPLALLLGILVAYTRLSADRELVALATLGVPKSQVMWVPIVCMLLVSSICVPLSIWLKPWSISSVRDTVFEFGLRSLTTGVQAGVFYPLFDGLYLRVEQVENEKWRGVVLIDERESKRMLTTVAPMGTVQVDTEKQRIQLELEDAQIVQRTLGSQEMHHTQMERAKYVLDFSQVLENQFKFAHVFESWSNKELKQKAAALGDGHILGRRYLHELARRWSLPFAPFAFGLIGLALASRTWQRGSAWVYPVSVSGVLIYFLLLRVGDAAVKNQVLSPIAANWLPNILLASLGCILLYRWRHRY